MVDEDKLDKVLRKEDYIIKRVDKTKKILAGAVLVLLGAFLIYALIPYINAFFGAIILFIISRPLYKYLNEKLKLRKGLSAIIVIVLSIFIILIPLIFIVNSVIGEVRLIVESKDIFIKSLGDLESRFPQLRIKEFIRQLLPEIADFLKDLLLNFIQGIGRFIIVVVIMYFVLYYLLINDKWLAEKLYTFIPFNKKNAIELIEEFRNVTYSTIVAAGIIALVQGGLLTIGFLVFGIKGALLLGVLTVILSFLPVVGAPIIWIPVVIWQFFQHNYPAAIGLFVIGMIVSNIDNFIRPYLQNKLGKMHPLVSLVGIFVGVPFFGLLGIIIGPLLLSYFLLAVRMFKEEYFNSN